VGRMLPVSLIACIDARGIPSPKAFTYPARGIWRSHRVRVVKTSHNYEINFAGRWLRYCRLIGDVKMPGRVQQRIYTVMYDVRTRQWFVFLD